MKMSSTSGNEAGIKRSVRPISELRPQVHRYIVLAGEFKKDRERPAVHAVRIKWSYLARKGVSAVLAFRINAEAAKLLETPEGAQSLARAIGTNIGGSFRNARAAKVSVSGIQIDYDCPSSRLADYATFLKILKTRIPATELSVTALPTWLARPAFKEVAANTGHYVLQLHTFEIPRKPDDLTRVFLSNQAASCTETASRIGRPFYVSLPTYSYEVAYDAKNRFAGLRAEQAPSFREKGLRYRTVSTDPGEILSFTRTLKKEPPPHFLGICWFRLPLKTDELNWDIKTLRAVLDGREPKFLLQAAVVPVGKGLCEIYLVNRGERNASSPVRFAVGWGKDAPIFYDLLGGCRAMAATDRQGLAIEGPAPKVGKRAIVAWFRSAKSDCKSWLNVSEVTDAKKKD